MKNVKNLLLGQKFIYRLKFSSFFQLYQSIFRKQAREQEKRELHFYKTFLPTCKLIFDIGAYDGHKTEAFRRIAERVVCCEPDKKNFNLLSTRFRNQKKHIFLENKSVGSQVGRFSYYINNQGSAFNTLSLKFKNFAEEKGKMMWSEEVSFHEQAITEMTTLDQLIEKYGLPDFIKIDTEGYEVEVIKGLSQPVPYLSFECIYPEFKDELLQILDHLEKIYHHHIQYNLSFEEELLLPEFISGENLFHCITSKHLPYFEVIACRTFS